jgi:hypothetical protein
MRGPLFLQAGLFLSNVNLRGAPSIEEVQSRVAAYVAVLQQQEERQKEWLLAQGHALVAGEMPLLWVTGGQWMEGSWGGALPHKSWLDAVTGPYRPALLSRMDSHAAIANSAALALGGLHMCLHTNFFQAKSTCMVASNRACHTRLNLHLCPSEVVAALQQSLHNLGRMADLAMFLCLPSCDLQRASPQPPPTHQGVSLTKTSQGSRLAS